ncbi:methyltransferase domain-containing protein [Flavobacteriaceae bacterium Ap0902]|nr:methyltransferase domain-containing protein [Flavobacteriaceae bacterium Ap0902]
MSEKLVKNWNNRYQQDEYAYGKEPNQFYKEQIDNLKPGKALFVAEGEGRNAVYAAKLGWDVHAFDISIEGKRKAERLAEENQVNIAYQVGELPTIDYQKESFDLIVLIFAHLPPAIRTQYHELLKILLKKEGMIILEAFGKNNLAYRNKNPNIGGPQQLEMLLDTQELEDTFQSYKIIQLEEKEGILKEGIYHNGKASLVNFIGIK